MISFKKSSVSTNKNIETQFKNNSSLQNLENSKIYTTTEFQQFYKIDPLEQQNLSYNDRRSDEKKYFSQTDSKSDANIINPLPVSHEFVESRFSSLKNLYEENFVIDEKNKLFSVIDKDKHSSESFSQNTLTGTNQLYVSSSPENVNASKFESIERKSYKSLLFCIMCDKKFSTEEMLKRHMKSHAGVTCHLCTQLFKDRLSLAKHQVEVHSSERSFACSQCDKTFKEIRTLRLHLKIHNSEYPEQCGVCNKVFRTKWQLKQHLMDHGGERPYPCPECPFTCKTKQQLNEHRRKHSGEKAYSCPQCGTRFTYRNGLIKHTKLNRCPKKVVTPDGETIIKKRSRILTKFPPIKNEAQMEYESSEKIKPFDTTIKTEKTDIDQKILDALQSENLNKNCKAASSAPDLESSSDISSWASLLPAGTKVTVTHYDASKKSGKNGEFIATPTHTQTILVTENLDKISTNKPTSQQKRLILTKGGFLPQLCSSEIDIASTQAADSYNLAGLNSPPHILPNKLISARVPILLSDPTSTTSNFMFSSSHSSQDNQDIKIRTEFQKFAPITSILQNSFYSIPPMSYSQEALNLFSSIGLAGYGEYFAVDPNEVLSNKRNIKSEPFMPTDLLYRKPCKMQVKSEPASPAVDVLKEFFTEKDSNGTNVLHQESKKAVGEFKQENIATKEEKRENAGSHEIKQEKKEISTLSNNLLTNDIKIETDTGFQSETMISFDDINNYTNIMSEQGSLLEQMTPLASPDSGYGEGCQIFHMSKESYQNPENSSTKIEEINTEITTSADIKHRRKSWLADLEVDFNALIKEIDENSSKIDCFDRNTGIRNSEKSS